MLKFRDHSKEKLHYFQDVEVKNVSFGSSSFNIS